ncbi:SRPBCC family protein [Nesterenkonia rhizosphaerae]|uniref:Coenzyme Q-binding protein COQ10 START domain-containing protein n=1 Tax=Nesterenkonia rhizosphaerae TaxID=1348272 RepID=A0ABP9FUH3_9MICC
MSGQDMFSGLKSHLGDYGKALARKAISSAGEKVDGLAERMAGGDGAASEGLKEGAEKLAEGKSPVSAAASGVASGAGDKIKSVFTGGSGSGGEGGSDNKFMNIVEWTDVGVPLRVAYNAFTQFEDWPQFMKKVENVERVDDTKLKIKGQVFLSHRTWEATITEQIPDSHIVWKSSGEKGRISGSVSFHEVTPTLTRILTVGEYHPQGFMERTGNLWRAVGRRFRLELKFYVHHVMTVVMRDQDSVEGWRGEIRDGEVVTTHEDALEQEAQEQEAQEQESQEQDEQDHASDSEQETYGEPVDDEDDDYSEPEDEDYADDEGEEEPSEDDEDDVEELPEDDEPLEDEAPAEDEDDLPEDDVEYDEEPAEDEEDEEPDPR